MSELIDPEQEVTLATVSKTKVKHIKTILDFIGTMPETKLVYRKAKIGKLLINDPDSTKSQEL